MFEKSREQLITDWNNCLAESELCWSPYGVWKCATGREILFNRSYCPLFERYPDNPPREADHGEWVKFIEQRWFYKDHASYKDRVKIGALILSEWGVKIPDDPTIGRIEAAFYRAYNESGVLLYIGITLRHNGIRRLFEHERAALWFGEVASITIVRRRFCTTRAALDHEATLIRDERPLHNRVHNRKPKPPSWLQ